MRFAFTWYAFTSTGHLWRYVIWFLLNKTTQGNENTIKKSIESHFCTNQLIYSQHELITYFIRIHKFQILSFKLIACLQKCCTPASWEVYKCWRSSFQCLKKRKNKLCTKRKEEERIRKFICFFVKLIENDNSQTYFFLKDRESDRFSHCCFFYHFFYDTQVLHFHSLIFQAPKKKAFEGKRSTQYSRIEMEGSHIRELHLLIFSLSDKKQSRLIYYCSLIMLLSTLISSSVSCSCWKSLDRPQSRRTRSRNSGKPFSSSSQNRIVIAQPIQARERSENFCFWLFILL